MSMKTTKLFGENILTDEILCWCIHSDEKYISQRKIWSMEWVHFDKFLELTIEAMHYQKVFLVVFKESSKPFLAKFPPDLVKTVVATPI